MTFKLPKIQKEVIIFLKKKIVSYDYTRYQGTYNNPLKTELGLDRTSYYAHPRDKYNPKRLYAMGYELEDLDEYNYDELYIYGNFGEKGYDEQTFKTY